MRRMKIVLAYALSAVLLLGAQSLIYVGADEDDTYYDEDYDEDYDEEDYSGDEEDYSDSDDYSGDEEEDYSDDEDYSGDEEEDYSDDEDYGDDYTEYDDSEEDYSEYDDSEEDYSEYDDSEEDYSRDYSATEYTEKSSTGATSAAPSEAAPAADTAPTEAPAATPEPAAATPAVTETPKPEEAKKTEEVKLPAAGTKKGSGIVDLGDGMVRSALTGLPVAAEYGNRRPIAFMIDNVQDSIPQSDISHADIFYECEVETDLTRICAVIEQYDDLGKIGPLRSCRDYFISLVAGLDPIYEHYGQAAYALPYLESDDVDNISGLLSYGVEDGFFRDGPHSAPHNAYTSGSGMKRLIEAAGYRQNHTDDFYLQYSFLSDGETSQVAKGKDAAYVELGYPYNKPYFVYDPESGLYSRYQYGDAHMDMENGEQLKVKNIILEYQNGTTYQDSIYLHYVTEGSGKGKYIANGKAIDITWSRDSFYSPVVYKTKKGKVLKLEPGKTWVAVIRNDQLSECKIGPSADSLTCVAGKKAVNKAKQNIADWIASYKATEEVYLSQMAQMRTDNVAKHGGKTKVEVGLP